MITKHKKRAVVTFIYALLAILGLFALTTIYTMTKLLDLRDRLNVITTETMPQLTQSAWFNNTIQMLTTEIAQLTGAQSEPERRLIRQETNNLLAQLNAGINADNYQLVSKQISIIQLELEDLNVLVEQKLALDSKLKAQTNAFTTSVTNALSEMMASKEQVQNWDNVDTQLEYDLLAILISVKTLEAETKLNNVRQTSAQLHRMVDDVEKSYLIRNGRVLNGQIKTTLEQYQSLVDIKAEYLLLAGRTRGRDSFIRNLISDLASGLEYQTQLIYRDILRSAEETSKQVTRQTHIVVSFSILTLLISLALVYVLYQRFVVRLVSLTEQVDAATASNVTTINVAGQDEISYLATVFSNYLSKVQKQELSLMEMSLSDPLTGIPNRRAFEANVKGAIDHAKRQQSFLSIVMVDIDFFKAYNDEYGHNQGDYCLQQVATALQETVARNTDFCARYGGEEFICVLPETDPAGAALKADQLHHAIKNLSISHAKSHASELLTLSIGVATFRFNEKKTWDVTTIVDEADKALYDAKNTGRNKTCFSFFV